MSRRVVIIGAGPGGLAAALLLAKAGLPVTVLERRSVVGGRTSTLVLDGFRFDVGPTFFLYPRVLREIFAAVGRDFDREVPMVRLDPQYRLIFGEGGELVCTPNLEKLQRGVAAFAPRDAANLPRFFSENRDKLDRFKCILESPFLSWTDLFRPEMLKALPVVRPWNSLDRELKRYFQDQRTRLAFSFQAKYLGMSPFQCPGLFSILSFLEYEHGVFHPLGGCGAVSVKMAEIARDLGVDLRLGEGVESIQFSGRRAVGVTTSRQSYPAEALVVNADFAQAMHRLVPNHLRRRWTDAKLAKKQYSCSTFMLYLGVDGIFPELAHHTIWLAKNYEQNLHDIEHGHRLSEDPSFYVQNACVTDPSLAPPGASTLYVLAPVTHQHANVEWSKAAPAFRAKILDQLRHLGLVDLERRIRVEKMVTPADWEKDHQIYRGATFNLAHSLQQMLHLRPHNRFEDLDGVYLVGGGTHPGSGLPVIFESARITSRLLLRDVAGVELPAAPPRLEAIPVPKSAA